MTPPPGATEADARAELVEFGRLLYLRGLVHGSTGNVSVRVPDGFLMTPTNACLGRLEAPRLSKLAPDGTPVAGDKPSKEWFMHLAYYQARPDVGAVVHTHSSHAVAVSCLEESRLDPDYVIPPITPYHIMRIGRLPVVPYIPPGHADLGTAIAAHAPDHTAVLLANHGPVVSGKTLAAAVYALEELEEAARLFLMLQGLPTRTLTADQIEDLVRTWVRPSSAGGG